MKYRAPSNTHLHPGNTMQCVCVQCVLFRETVSTL